MKYYITDNRIFDNCTKEPTFMKKYPYYKIAWSNNATQTLVMAYEDVEELEPVSVEVAQAVVNQWAESQGIEPIDVSSQNNVIAEDEAYRLHNKFGV